MIQPIKLDYSQIADVVVEDIDIKDCPDYCDAFISSATYMNREMTDEELEVLNNDRDFVYEKTLEALW